MRRIMIRMTPLILFIALFSEGCLAQAPGGTDDGMCAGCYSSVPVTGEAVRNAAAFAVKAERDALRKEQAGESTELQLVEILRAEEQVVAGMNYRLELKVKLNGEEKTARAVVYEALWKPIQRELTSWDWD